MPDRKNKVLSHRRAEWTVASPPTLEACIKSALNKQKTISGRTIFLDDGREIKCLSANTNPDGGGVLIHLTIETPGEQASIVPTTDQSKTDADIGTVDAPADAEFMDGDAFLYTKDDDVCLCGTNFNENTMKVFFYEFFKKTNIRKDSVKFDLFKTIDMEKLKMLHNEKVKEIRLKASVYKASAAYAQRQNDAAGLAGSVSRWIRAFCGAEHDVTNDSMRVEVTLKTDKRSPQHLAVGERRIEEIAQNLIEHEQEGDEYVIELESGKTISPKEMFVRMTVTIEGHGKSVNRQKAWNQLQDFYVGLGRSKILET